MDLIECGRMSICFYVRQAGPLLHNLATRLGTEMADVAVGMKRRILYPIRRLLTRYDDVLPPDDQFHIEENGHPSPTLSTKKTPTPEVKKPQPLPPPDHKPPPPVDRPSAYQNQRPLPPTPESSKLKEQNNAGSRRGSRSTAVTQMPWYHNVDRKGAAELLRNSVDGTFILRPSSQAQNPLSLTLWFNSRMYNISVRHRPDGKFALGYEKPNEESFTSIEELVVNYQSENLVLYSNGERTGRTLLTGWPPRRD